MGDSLPEPSFNKFVMSKILEFERREADNFVSKLEEIAGQVIDSAREDRAIIFRILIYDSESLECRFWVYGDKILYTCTGNKITDEYLKIYIEILEATNLVAAYDVERARALGFQINAKSKNSNIIISTIKSVIGLDVSAPQATMTIAGGITRAAPVPSKAIAISPDIALEECIRRLSLACGYGKCGEAPREILDEHGVVAAGSGSKYICVIHNFRGCSYVILEIYEGDSKIDCVESKEEALEAINNIIREGGKLVTV